MNIQEQIENYINSLEKEKASEIEALHQRILNLLSKSKLWFLDGKDEQGKIVANPNIGYGSQIIKYANGTAKEFYKIGLSANSAGISVYVIGFPDKKFLTETYGKAIGKANVTGYCIRFKSVKDINIDVLETAIMDCIKQTT